MQPEQDRAARLLVEIFRPPTRTKLRRRSKNHCEKLRDKLPQRDFALALLQELGR